MNSITPSCISPSRGGETFRNYSKKGGGRDREIMPKTCLFPRALKCECANFICNLPRQGAVAEKQHGREPKNGFEFRRVSFTCLIEFKPFEKLPDCEA